MRAGGEMLLLLPRSDRSQVHRVHPHRPGDWRSHIQHNYYRREQPGIFILDIIINTDSITKHRVGVKS